MGALNSKKRTCSTCSVFKQNSFNQTKRTKLEVTPAQSIIDGSVVNGSMFSKMIVMGITEILVNQGESQGLNPFQSSNSTTATTTLKYITNGVKSGYKWIIYIDPDTQIAYLYNPKLVSSISSWFSSIGQTEPSGLTEVQSGPLVSGSYTDESGVSQTLTDGYAFEYTDNYYITNPQLYISDVDSLSPSITDTDDLSLEVQESMSSFSSTAESIVDNTATLSGEIAADLAEEAVIAIVGELE
jgi:hypothetical protein